MYRWMVAVVEGWRADRCNFVYDTGWCEEGYSDDGIICGMVKCCGGGGSGELIL